MVKKGLADYGVDRVEVGEITSDRGDVIGGRWKEEGSVEILT